MFQSIMVPLDGSPFGEEALPLAEALARRSAARLHLVHVHPTREHDEDDPSHPDEARAYLQQVTDGTCHDLGESCSFALLPRPSAEGLGPGTSAAAVSRALETYVHAQGVELVVMTTHGRSGLSRAWLGSVADAFVRHAGVPVLLLRPGKGPEGAAERARAGFRTVLVPLDASAAAKDALDPARALAGEDARLILARVVPPSFEAGSPYALASVQVDPQTTNARRAQAQEALADVADTLRGQWREVTPLVVVDPMPGEAILRCAEENDADCVAMATRGLAGWSRVVLGSTADKVVRGASLPILLLRRPEAEQAPSS